MSELDKSHAISSILIKMGIIGSGWDKFFYRRKTLLRKLHAKDNYLLISINLRVLYTYTLDAYLKRQIVHTAYKSLTVKMAVALMGKIE